MKIFTSCIALWKILEAFRKAQIIYQKINENAQKFHKENRKQIFDQAQ